MEINEYIDFQKMFDKLAEENMQCLEEDAEEYEKDILTFIKENPLQLVLSECELRDDLIVFDFGEEQNDANESNNQNSWISVIITYNRRDELFSSYSYEQG